MSQPLKTFIIYSRKDESFKNELMLHLRGSLVSTGYLDVWQDGEILPGEDWQKIIEEKLETSDLFLVLVSIYSLTSDFIQKIELVKALEQKGRIVPVLIRNCIWKTHSVFAGLQGLPKNMQPVTSFLHYDDAWTEVVEELQVMVEQIRAAERAEIETQAKAEKQRQERIQLEEQAKAEKQRQERIKLEEQAKAEKHRQALIASLNQPGLPEMVFVPGGAFLMGDEEGDLPDFCRPVHQVTLSDFFIGKYPVTQKEWQAVIGNNPSKFKGESLPVENISWNDCQEYLTKLSEKTGLKYRLPTEAEWEYAARGGQLSNKTKYAGCNDLDEVGWYRENSGKTTHPVGKKKPNELGLYDMSGNVWEVCGDSSGRYTSAVQTNPTGAKEGNYGIRRGGCCYYDQPKCRLTFRDTFSQGYRYFLSGFRLAFALQ